MWSMIRGKKAVEPVEMRDENWVPDVERHSCRLIVRSAQSQDERDLRWRNAPIVLETDGVTKHFGGITAAEDLAHRTAQGHDHRARRSERRRQDHRVQPADRFHPARRAVR